jgi:hypothetical protein
VSRWANKRRGTPAEKARERDYNSTEHQAIKAARRATAGPHTPCTCPGRGKGGCKHHDGPCGKPLGPDVRLWHVPHNADRTGYLPGIWCAPCNRSEAASRAARLVNARRKASKSAASTFRRPTR